MTTFERIKKLADKQQISLKELALKLDMGENSIFRWKSKTPTVDNLQKVADYFNVTTDYLLGRTDNPYLNEKLEELINDRELNAWLYDMIENRPEDIKRVKEIMDIMVTNPQDNEK
ncbi:helix-turn-helix transcriptional regulator [Listeria booriae]|uniref:helix-turn-helix domain-containing protein n=1 Tax=Listeria booriae TaxID=1552123 RepID=UPI00162A1D69|nr:helix-turn-helix transcriptional regulator [Listeria booriae]MBC1286910.1 helix-turn-helix transcriptional regulator [Listeria booriae]